MVVALLFLILMFLLFGAAGVWWSIVLWIVISIVLWTIAAIGDR